MDKEITAMAAFTLAIVGLFLVLFYGLYQEQKAWESFKVAHNCRVVAHEKGGVRTGFGTGVTASGKVGTGVVMVVDPDKTCWECDDGKLYWR